MKIFNPDPDNYSAARAGTVYIRFDRGVLRGAGADRLDLLHRLSTNATRDLAPGDETTTILTSDKGRVVEVLVVGDGGAALQHHPAGQRGAAGLQGRGHDGQRQRGDPEGPACGHRCSHGGSVLHAGQHRAPRAAAMRCIGRTVDALPWTTAAVAWAAAGLRIAAWL